MDIQSTWHHCCDMISDVELAPISNNIVCNKISASKQPSNQEMHQAFKQLRCEAGHVATVCKDSYAQSQIFAKNINCESTLVSNGYCHGYGRS